MDKVLRLAAVEAESMGANLVGVEDIFLAILEEDESVPAQVLKRQHVRDEIRAELRRSIGAPEYRGTAPSRH